MNSMHLDGFFKDSTGKPYREHNEKNGSSLFQVGNRPILPATI